MSEHIKLGVVGCGVVATAYYLPYIMQMNNAELVAVCDIYEERTAACQRLFKAKESYHDYTQMIRQADIDAVLILTAPGTHVSFTMTALEAGKHVLIQKPMALNMEDARAIAHATKESGLVVLVEPSESSLLDPHIVELRKLVDQGVLGDPYWFSFFEPRFEEYHPSLGGNPYGIGAFYSEDSGGVLFDYPYAPTKIVSLLGSCKSVTGMAKLSVPNRTVVPDESYNDFLKNVTDPQSANYWDVVLNLPKSQNVSMGAPDNVFSIYELENGWTGVFHIGRPFHPTLKGTGAAGLQIFGSEGNLITGNGYSASIISSHKDLLPEVSEDGWYHIPNRGGKSKWPVPAPGSFNYYHESTKHFVDCILAGKQPLLDVDWGLHITEMLFGAIESSKTGRRYEMTTHLPSIYLD